MTSEENPVPEGWERSRSAYHEAGHALAAHRLGEHVSGLTVEADGSFDETTFVAYTHVEFDRAAILAEPEVAIRRGTVIAVAGTVGECQLVPGSTIYDGIEHPLDHVRWAMGFSLWRSRIEERPEDEIFAELAAEAEALVTDEWGWGRFIEVANALAEEGHLTRERFLELLA